MSLETAVTCTCGHFVFEVNVVSTCITRYTYKAPLVSKQLLLPAVHIKKHPPAFPTTTEQYIAR